jgi:hypothetical protein
MEKGAFVPPELFQIRTRAALCVVFVMSLHNDALGECKLGFRQS